MSLENISFFDNSCGILPKIRKLVKPEPVEYNDRVMKRNEIKLIAFDLDGTLLDDGKNVPDENLRALEKAKEAGIELVPATGRLYKAVPDFLKDICRYFMLINGAKVYDSREDRVVYEAYIPWDLAMQIYSYGDSLDVIYDAYIDDNAYMSQNMWDMFSDYMVDKNYAVSMKQLRTPVEDLKKKVFDGRCSVQKAQYFFKDLDERDAQLRVLKEKFPRINPTVSLGSNIEINIREANKGAGLAAVCRDAGIDIQNAVAFGDGTNDLAMIVAAGTGVCMKNGASECRDAADIVTEYDNNSAGMGREIEKLLDL